MSDIEDDAKVQNEDDDDNDNGDGSNGKELQAKDVEIKDGNAEKATSQKVESRKRKAPENNEKGSPNKKVMYFCRGNAERFLSLVSAGDASISLLASCSLGMSFGDVKVICCANVIDSNSRFIGLTHELRFSFSQRPCVNTEKIVIKGTRSTAKNSLTRR